MTEGQNNLCGISINCQNRNTFLFSVFLFINTHFHGQRNAASPAGFSAGACAHGLCGNLHVRQWVHKTWFAHRGTLLYVQRETQIKCFWFFFLGISFLQCEKTMNRRICWRYKTRSVSEVTNLRATHCRPQAGTHKKYLCMHVDRVKFSIIALSMSENEEFQPIV